MIKNKLHLLFDFSSYFNPGVRIRKLMLHRVFIKCQRYVASYGRMFVNDELGTYGRDLF
jgi:hypothetical protein